MIAATNNHMYVRLAGTAQQPVAAVTGDIDQDSGADLQRALTIALDASPRRLTIDMTGVGFTDSNGLNVLLRMRERARHAGKILSLRPGRCLARLLEVTETGSLFTIEP
ncbi:STAS domain-containing protein [Streptomyces kaniharaensis]|uniref:STAS domain-containing protein n=1 Tax=Streptomyces kaniharaensis TaxID=212423 RepID=UPI0018A83D2E|nr:STAS domain-containing protein [Streptomyces kaniharaensis]